MATISNKISVIIVNLNGKEFLKPCLDSVLSQSFDGLEVIVVDNGSTDDSVEFIKTNYDGVVVIENGENLGFAEANNIGIEKSSGEYILALNNDTVIGSGFFESLAKSIEKSDDKTAMWAPKILSIFDKETIDSVGGLLVSRCGIAKGRGRNEKDIGQYDESDAFIPSGCAALYEKTMLDHVGVFDRDFFAYCEDTDLGLRAVRAGYSSMNVPGAVVYHHYSGTTGKYSLKKAFLVERNHLWVVAKNFSLLNILLLPFYNIYRYVLQLMGIILGKGSASKAAQNISPFKLAFTVVQACISAMIKLPVMLKRRFAIKGSLKIKKDQSIAIKKIALSD